MDRPRRVLTHVRKGCPVPMTAPRMRDGIEIRDGSYATVEGACRTVQRLRRAGWTLTLGIVRRLNTFHFTVERPSRKPKKAISPETKEQLQEMARKKRGTLLKDVSTDDLLILCDYAEENATIHNQWSYLLRASDEQIDALRGRLPNREHVIPHQRQGLKINREIARGVVDGKNRVFRLRNMPANTSRTVVLVIRDGVATSLMDTLNFAADDGVARVFSIDRDVLTLREAPEAGRVRVSYTCNARRVILFERQMLQILLQRATGKNADKYISAFTLIGNP